MAGERLSRRPLIWLAAAFGAGAWLADVAAVETGWWLAAAALAALVGALATPKPRVAVVALAAAAVAVGGAGAAADRARFERQSLGVLAATAPVHPVWLVGRLASDVRVWPDHRSLLVDVERTGRFASSRPLHGRLVLRVYGKGPFPELVQGDRLGLWARLAPPRALGVDGAWDAAAYARRRGVAAIGTCKSPRLVRHEGPAGSSRLRDWIGRARAWARRALDRHVLPGIEQGLVRAMVVGDRSGVGEDASEAFRIAGTYHVLALSGAQVALVVGLLLWLLGRARVGPLPAAAVVCAAAAFYAEFVGGDVPVVRAAVMAAVLVAGRALDLDADLVNLLGLAALILLAFRPCWVGDVGFQLSFGATLGILVLAGPLAGGMRRLPLRGELALAASLAAQAALVPLLAWHFNRLAPAALLMNLVAAPLASAVLLSGFAVVAAAALVPGLAALAGDVAWMAAHGLLASGGLVEGNELLDVRLPVPALGAAALYLAGLFAAADARRRARALPLLAAGALWLALGVAPRPADGRLRLVVLDVGQGDSLVVHGPSGRVMVVDAGGRSPGFDLGERAVAAYLWRHGVRRIDVLVLSHAHTDHVGGVPALLAAFEVGQVWEGPAPRRSRVYRELSGALSRSRARRLAVRRGSSVEWDGVRVSVLGPAPDGPAAAVRNDDSLVLSLEFRGARLLLTGDVEGAGERMLRAPPAAVLKVPHHGSGSSSSPGLLERVRPEVAVVSAGWRNRFGHPAPAVLARYRERGTRLLRTDREGTVTIATDGSRLWLQSHAGARESWWSLR